MSERRRIVVIVAVLALLALAGVANATIKRHRDLFLGPSSTAAETITLSNAQVSGAWYCPGPLPIRGKGDSGAIAVVNLSRKKAIGQLDIALSSGAHSIVGVAVAPNSQTIVSIPHSTNAGFAAATLLSTSTGLGAVEIIETASGRSVASCVNRTGSQAYVAPGSTKPPADVALSLFDPGATPAVVNVSFATPTGIVAPPAFQGLPLGANELEVLDVGHYLPSQAVASTIVTSLGGRIVAGAFEVALVNTNLSSSILAGTQSGTSFLFAPAPSGPSAHQVLSIADASGSKADVAIDVAGSSGTSSESTALLPGTVDAVQIASDKDPNALGWAEIESTNGVPIVVGRSVVISSVIRTAKARASSSALLAPETIPPGVALANGVSTLARIWLVAGGVSNLDASEVVVIANPSSHASSVTINELGTPSGSLARRLHLFALRVAAKGTLAVNLGSILENTGAVALVVRSSQPVLAGSEIYARGSSGSLGFAAPSAIPVD